MRRVWAFGHRYATEWRAHLPAARTLDTASLPAALADLRREVHLLLRQANYDFGKFQFNTVASAAMKMLNAMEKVPADAPPALAAEVVEESLSILIRLLSPITPHLTHVLWQELGYAQGTGTDLLDAPWPEPVAAALAQDEIELVLQINGKHRGSLRVPADADKAQVEALARGAEAAAGAAIRRVVVVPGRLVNVVL